MPPVATDPLSLTLSLSQDQHRWLENASRFLSDETGRPVTMASVVMRLMEYGAPLFDDELADLRARGNAGQKRFPKVQLALVK